MKKAVIGAFAALTMAATSANAIAGLVDVEIGAGVWNASPSGQITYGKNVTDEIDFKDDLKLDDTSNSYMYLRFDHFIPIVPNVRLEQQNYTTTGKGAISVATGFGDVSITGNTETDVKLNQQDIILYWGIPGLNALTAGVLDIELGIDVKKIDGELTVTDGTNTDTVDFSVPVPMGYAAVLVDIPFIPVGLEVSTKMISSGDSKIQDTKAKVDVTLPLPIPLIELAVEGGMKQQTIQIADDLVDDLDMKFQTSGIFFGANVKF
jgi:outer membrane protein